MFYRCKDCGGKGVYVPKRKSDDDSGSSCSGTDDFGGSGGSH